jgi:GntR family transcriptional regulator
MGLPFSIDIRPGRPLHDQVVFAVTKAIVSGQLAAGDAFPSVRSLSQELQINPNTAQKIVATLIERRLLEPRPGIGTVVAAWRPAANPARRAVLASQMDRMLVEARQLGMTLNDVLEAIRRAWK